MSDLHKVWMARMGTVACKGQAAYSTWITVPIGHKVNMAEKSAYIRLVNDMRNKGHEILDVVSKSIYERRGLKRVKVGHKFFIAFTGGDGLRIALAKYNERIANHKPAFWKIRPRAYSKKTLKALYRMEEHCFPVKQLIPKE